MMLIAYQTPIFKLLGVAIFKPAELLNFVVEKTECEWNPDSLRINLNAYAKKWREEFEKLRMIVLDCQLTEELKWGKPIIEMEAILKTTFDALTPGRQRAYFLYFSAPKQSKTREPRVEKCMQRILKGKGLNDQ